MGEEELNKDRLALALEAAGLDLWENDLVTGKVTLKAVKTFAELGYSEEESFAYMDNLFAIVHPEDVPFIKTAINEHSTGATPEYRCEFRLKAKDGSWVWYANYGKIIQSSNYEHGKRFIGVTFNINKRKCQENELRIINLKLAEQNETLERLNNTLRESEEKFRLMFNSSPDAVSIIRADNDLYVDINEGFIQATGFTRDGVIGKTSLELNIWQDYADRERLAKGLREKGYVENLEAQFRRKDGSLVTGLMSTRLISLKGVPHIISITRDITEHKKHRNERLKIEKLESLGILAGGIAHDFNNILTGIMGNISFAKVFLDATHTSYTPLAEAEKASIRAGELAHQLLTFARGGEPVKKLTSLKKLVDESVSLVLHGSNVKGTIDIPDSIHAIEADEGQMSQVFHNIIINATQAMPGGGILTIAAKNEILSDNNAFSLPPGSYVRLTFADQGCGIPGDALTRIFDPYFTTKSSGNGLGLASAHSIINRHRGHIGVSSAVGEGATFTIYLPSRGEIYKERHTGTASQTPNERKGGHVLVMDDEDMVRDIATTMLTHLGYEVTTCKSGEKAVELYKISMESGMPFLTVIMDLTVPGGLGGKDAADQILSLFPKAHLIVSSGYSNDPIMSNYQEYGFSGAIAKPYSLGEFEQVLGSSG